jgi:hypothetical protein
MSPGGWSLHRLYRVLPNERWRKAERSVTYDRGVLKEVKMMSHDRNPQNEALEQDLSLDELELEEEIQNEELDELENDAELAEEFAASYGTGVREIPGYVVENRGMYDAPEHNEHSATLTGGDVDANAEQAIAEGDESVGGTAPTPDMDVVDELARAVGLEMDDASFLRTNDVLEQRDDRRWELEPRSAEDYEERQED